MNEIDLNKAKNTIFKLVRELLEVREVKGSGDDGGYLYIQPYLFVGTFIRLYKKPGGCELVVNGVTFTNVPQVLVDEFEAKALKTAIDCIEKEKAYE